MADALSLLQQIQARNAQREQQLLGLSQMMEQRRAQERSQAVQMAQAGVPLADIEKAIPTLDLQGYTLAKINADQLKRRQQEAEAAATAGTAEQLIAAGGPVAQRPAGLNEALNERVAMLQQQLGPTNPDLLTQFLTRLGTQQALTDAAAQAQQAKAEQKFRDAIALEREKAGIQETSSLRIDAAKRIRDLQDKIADQERSRALSHYTNLMQDALISENGLDERAQENIIAAIATDPALGGANALANWNIIQMDALSAARGAQGELEAARNIAERTGVRIPRRIAQDIVAGNAVEDTFTGLPLRAKTSAERQRLAAGAAAVDALARAQAAAQRVASGGKGGSGTAEFLLTAPARAVGIGPSDPDLNEYDSARNQLGEMLVYALTGTQSPEQQIQRIMGFMPKVSELDRDPKTGGLTPNARRRIESAYRLVTAFVTPASLVDQNVTRDIYRKKFDERVKQYATPEDAASPQDETVVRDPRLPAIDKPGGR